MNPGIKIKADVKGSEGKRFWRFVKAEKFRLKRPADASASTGSRTNQNVLDSKFFETIPRASACSSLVLVPL